MIRKFNEYFHKSRLFRFSLVMLIWLIGGLIFRPYTVNVFGVILVPVVWFVLETLMYGWDFEI